MKNSKLCYCKTNNKSKKNNSKTYRIKLRNGTSRQIKVIEIQLNFKKSKPINLNFKKNWKLNNNKSKRSSKPIRINCKKSLMLSKFSYNNNFMPTRLFFKKRLWPTNRSLKKSSLLSCSKIINKSSKTINNKLIHRDRKTFQQVATKLSSKKSRVTKSNFKKSQKKNRLSFNSKLKPTIGHSEKNLKLSWFRIVLRFYFSNMNKLNSLSMRKIKLTKIKSRLLVKKKRRTLNLCCQDQTQKKRK